MSKSFLISLKATVFAAILFWSLNIAAFSLSNSMVPFMILSVIPIWIVCYMTLLITIVPFNTFKNSKTTNKQVFNWYFPYYSICCFVCCTLSCLYFNFNSIAINFFTTAFFTTSISWVWFFKNEEKLLCLMQ